ncbi:hypothetical protein Tco_0506987, partial [Tanacetum coccineum]
VGYDDDGGVEIEMKVSGWRCCSGGCHGGVERDDGGGVGDVGVGECGGDGVTRQLRNHWWPAFGWPEVGREISPEMGEAPKKLERRGEDF